jgi:peptide chain release factor subunit 1
MYQILVIDYNECTFAKVYSDAEIEIIFKKHSDIPNKHKSGGQSAQRFERIRQECIKQWFKRINEYLKPIEGEIIIGISSIYYKRFIKYLSTYNKNKIQKRVTSEYANISGIYNTLNILTECS